MNLKEAENFWKPATIAFLLVLIYASVIWKLFWDCLADENYSHSLLVPFLIALIIWLEQENLKKTVKSPNPVAGLTLIFVAFVLLLFGTLGSELFLQRISVVLVSVGIVLYFFGSKVANLLLVPFLLLTVSIPLPQIIFNKIAFPLQLIASQIAVWGIRLSGIPSVVKGNVIEILPVGALQPVALEVVEACSGIRSLMTLATLAILIAYFTKGNPIKISLKNPDFWRMLLLIISAVPVAVVTNAFRVTLIGILTHFYGRQTAEGFTHDVSGWLVYLSAFVILLGLNALLKKVLKWQFQTTNRHASIQTHQQASSQQVHRNTSQTLEPQTSMLLQRNASFAVLVVTLLLGLALVKWFEHRPDLTPTRKALQAFPRVLGDWKQIGSDSRFSDDVEKILQASDYVMRDYALPDGTVANLYIGYYDAQLIGSTYHSPQNCLPGSGWELKNPSFVKIHLQDGKEIEVRFYVIENVENRELMIYWYQGRGRFTGSEYEDRIYKIIDKMTKRRSDGAMIRITIPSNENEDAEKLEKLKTFSALVIEQLNEFVPN